MKKHKLALIAGSGNLPNIIIDKYKSNNLPIFVLGITGAFDSNDANDIDLEMIKLGEIIRPIKLMQDKEITEIVFAGGIKRPSFSSIKTDAEGLKLLAKITSARIKGDDNILKIIADYLETKGFKIIAPHEVVPDIIANKGPLTKFLPNDIDIKDIQIGKDFLDVISDFDVGQALVIEDGVILAIEGAEGTENLIKRTKDLRKNKERSGILIKIKKKNQDNRLDLPAIGIDTVNQIFASEMKGIALMSGNSIILNKEQTIEYANNLGIFIYCI